MRQLGIRVDHQATEPTSEGVVEALSEIDLHGKMVGLQLTGEANDYLKSELERRGARVVEVSPYEYRLASSEDQVNELIAKIIKAEVQIVTFTTAPQVRALFAQVAQTGERDELRRALSERVAIASIGPVVDRALGEENLLPHIKPERSVMGSLAKAVGAFLKQ
jgi:uroporphyrinogen-III synthase